MLSSFLAILQNGVTITADIPEVIEAGTEITVNVTIKKGKQTGFARFQQELPVGFTAKPLNSAYADFSFQEQKVRLVWLNIPDNNEINFSYKVIANELLTGEVDLQGRYFYIENNENRWTDLQTQALAITPSPNVDPDSRIDVKEFAKYAEIKAQAEGSGQTVAFRQQPVWLEEDKVFLVTLLVNKDAAKKYAKIEEKTPAGFVAAGLDSKGGIFSYRNNVAQIIWMDMPAEPYFTVSYKLIPEDGAAVNQETLSIAGDFTFMVNDRTFTAPIIERKEQLARLNKEQLNNILRDIDFQIDEVKQQSSIAGNDKPKSDGASDEQIAKREPPPTPQRQTGSTGTASSRNQDFILMPEPGVRYRVQIAAGKKEINIPRYFRNHRLEYRVFRDEHEGWYKYLVGSFAEYRDARDYRVQLWNTTVSDAFVAAYNNGKRIHVQDALMATNQKYVK
jgi:hypothetical protein